MTPLDASKRFFMFMVVISRKQMHRRETTNRPLLDPDRTDLQWKDGEQVLQGFCSFCVSQHPPEGQGVATGHLSSSISFSCVPLSVQLGDTTTDVCG